MIQRIKTRLISCLFGKGARLAYSQEGEDLLLERFLDNQRDGFYVDIGAHHPTRFSNTYRLYQNGWSGIVIDPLPGTRRLFSRKRPRDLCLEVGVSATPGNLKYYAFSDPALNTFSEQLATARQRETNYRLTRTDIIPTLRLDDILSRHLPANTNIDVLTIDVEGLDLEVLQSNDWLRWRPKLVLAESLCVSSLQAVVDGVDPVARFMRSIDYLAVARTYNTVFYQASVAR